MLEMAVGGQCLREDEQELHLPVIGAARRRGEEGLKRDVHSFMSPCQQTVFHGRIGTPSSQLRKQERVSTLRALVPCGWRLPLIEFCEGHLPQKGTDLFLF